MSSLAEIRKRLQETLMDTGASIWPTDTLDEALRRALQEYSGANPAGMETYLTLVAADFEISLSSLARFRKAIYAHWPYDHTAAAEDQEDNRIKTFTLFWDAGVPNLVLHTIGNQTPASGDEVRLWYYADHTIEDLDSASATTLPTIDETVLVAGAAGFAAMSRAVDLMETPGQDLFVVVTLGTWGRGKEREFRAALKAIAEREAASGPAIGFMATSGSLPAWRMDKWDRGY